MNRRNFLKILSAAPLVAAVPVLAKTDTADFISDDLSAAKFDVHVDPWAECANSVWEGSYGDTRYVPGHSYKVGDIVVGTDGKKYKEVSTDDKPYELWEYKS